MKLKSLNRNNHFLIDYNNFMNQDKYISKKDMKHFLDIHKKSLDRLDDDILTQKIKDIIEYMDDSISLHNRIFVLKHMKMEEYYFSNLFKGIDSNIKLDKEQKLAVLCDEDYSIVLAGAGSGKTTTMSAKVKYLVEKQNVNPSEIIVISFTNQAVNELKMRINEEFNISANICTFHKFGMDILKKHTNSHLNILVNSYNVIKQYFEEKIINDKNKLEQFIKYFSLYLDIPTKALKFNSFDEFISYKARANYHSLKRNLKDYNQSIIDDKKDNFTSINGETFSSIEEVMIANYLYLNNIDYSYQKPYSMTNKLYYPDFTVYINDLEYYIEYFDINTKGYNKLYSNKDNIKYQKSILAIRKMHKHYKTELIELYSKYEDEKSFLCHLEEELTLRNIKIVPKDSKEVYEKIMNINKDIYYRKFIIFCQDFIQKYKIRGFERDYFKALKDKYKNDDRTSIFLELIEDAYIYYQKYLENNNYIDFEDMVVKAYNLLNEDKNISLNYKYIIIDEYQDISESRFNLIKMISSISDAKIIAVGDDWQSIFAFSGSNISLFTKFKELMGYALELKITNTYRNSQELIDVAGHFIMKNAFQLKKDLKSPKNLVKPIKLVAYNSDDLDKIKLLDKCIKNMILNSGDNQEILFIGRYTFDKKTIIHKDYFIEDSENKIKSINYPNLNITFLTAHSSKGLTYDNVVIINSVDDMYGFPSKIKDDPIMDIVNINNDNYDYSEERRLYYVALTRTKNYTYVLYPKDNPSIFVQELMEYENVEQLNIRKQSKVLCPKCKKYYLVKKYDPYYKINIYKCSSDKEICDFKTNNLDYKISLKKCPKCKKGLLIVKKNESNQYFIGCSNYKKNNCNFVKII